MTGRTEVTTPDGQRRYRATAHVLYVADRPAPDQDFRTVATVDIGPDGDQLDGHRRLDDGTDDPTPLDQETARDHLTAARRAGLDLGDRRRVADQAAAALDQLGQAWAAHLGSLAGPDSLIGARVETRDDPHVFDTVTLLDGTQVYRRDLPGDPPRWVVVGWSDTSRARRYRPAEGTDQ